MKYERDVETASKKLAEYAETYTDAKNWSYGSMAGARPVSPEESPVDDTYLHDMLYGVGSSLSEDYRFATGYRQFLQDLKAVIEDYEAAFPGGRKS